MAGVADDTFWVLGAALLLLGLVLAGVRMVKRWKRNMDVSDDTQYVETLANLSEGSVRRHFNPYTDIDWEAPEFSVTQNDPRWVLSATDPFGRHSWYQAQPLDKQIAVGMWRQANIAKVSLHLENVLIRGLMQYTFWVPNGSPEYRYCLHESVEESNHTMMFQEMVNRIGVDVPGLPRSLRWLSPWVPLWAGPLPIVFFFGVLAGEVPVDHMQKNVMREGKSLHPIMEKVMAIHVAEEAATSRLVTNSCASVSRVWGGLAGSGCRCTCRSSCGCCARRSSCRRADSSRSSTSRARCARNCVLARPTLARRCVTCSATSGCCATT